MVNMSQRKTAGELALKALSDNTKYDALEVGHAMADDIEKHLYESIEKHKNIIDENEFCVVMLIAKDNMIKNCIRRKFYCWPYLPKPRPNQAVFLYNKTVDRIVKRLWVLPSDMVMAELAATNVIVHKRYELMQAWSVAFFKSTFWEFIRHQHGIDMLSEHEYFLQHREELIKAGCKLPSPDDTESFDFDKINIDVEKIIDTQEALSE
jgi:hypothetical protein